MRSVVIVVGAPGFEHCTGVRERAEQGLVEQLVPQAADEGLGESVLYWLARRDVVPLNLVVVGPSQDGVAGQLGAIVADDGLGLAVGGQEPVELASNPKARDRGIGDQRQALAAAVIDDDQDAHAAAVNELIGHEVERPAVVRPLRHQHGRPRAQGPLAAAPPADHEALFAIEPEQAFVVHLEALPS